MSEKTPLQIALARGDPVKVAALVHAGADIHYRDADGYTALVNAVHGRDLRRDPRLLDLLKLLITKGVDLDAVTTYGESGLSVLSRLGRFDAVELLIDAGADEAQLAWTPLIRAVALRPISVVEALLDAGAPLEEVDLWKRTAWLVAVLVGDLDKAKLLRARGANVLARGHCDCPPLHYAVLGHHPVVLRWLLENGQFVDESDQFDHTALDVAIEHDDLACAQILLEAGANMDDCLQNADSVSRDLVLRLLAAGADPAQLTHEAKRALVNLPSEPSAELLDVSVEDFRRGMHPREGTANPTQMNEPFWLAMIRAGVTAYQGADRFATEPATHPVWCAQRFGQSITQLPDGRLVLTGGEHEDYYDEDFCIYNDVFVFAPDGAIDIYGYPEAIFPPTDFHTATLVGEHIYVIGSLGYRDRRRSGETQLLRLSTRTFAFEPLTATGDTPGWISRHRADLIAPGEIRVTKGKIAAGNTYGENSSDFVLDVERLTWRRA